jgi:hypothetical protein
MYELRARHTLTSYLLCRFTRAAHVMLASSELDGVIILDASIAATGHRQYPSAPEREHLSGNNSDSPGPNSKSESSEDSDSHSGNSEQNANSSSSKTCGILGAAPSRTVVNADGTPGVGSLAETNLARLLREYPHGKVFNYTLQGVSMSSTDDSSSAIGSPEGFLSSGRDPPRKDTAERLDVPKLFLSCYLAHEVWHLCLSGTTRDLGGLPHAVCFISLNPRPLLTRALSMLDGQSRPIALSLGGPALFQHL